MSKEIEKLLDDNFSVGSVREVVEMFRDARSVDLLSTSTVIVVLITSMVDHRADGELLSESLALLKMVSAKGLRKKLSDLTEMLGVVLTTVTISLLEADISSDIHALYAKSYADCVTILCNVFAQKGGKKYAHEIIDIDTVSRCWKLVSVDNKDVIKNNLLLLSECFYSDDALNLYGTCLIDTDLIMNAIVRIIGYMEYSEDISNTAALFFEHFGKQGNPCGRMIISAGALGKLVENIFYRNLKDQAILTIAAISSADEQAIPSKIVRGISSKITKNRIQALTLLNNRPILYSMQIAQKKGTELEYMSPSPAPRRKANASPSNYRIRNDIGSGFQNFIHNFEIHGEQNDKSGNDEDQSNQLRFLYRLLLGKLDSLTIKSISEYDLISFLPYICSLIRDQLLMLNKERKSYETKFYKRSWPVVVQALISRVEGSIALSHFLAALEELGLGLSCHKINTFDPFEYRINILYSSIQRRNTLSFYEFMGQKNESIDEGSDAINPMMLIDLICPVENEDIVKMTVVSKHPYSTSIKVEKSTGTVDRSYKMLLKYGFDMRSDLFGNIMLHVFNVLWEHSPLVKEHRPFVFRSTSVPVFHDISVTEFVTECVGIINYFKNGNPLKELNEEQILIFIRSAVGTYITSLVLGLNDRTPRNLKVTSSVINTPIMVMFHYENCFNRDKQYRKSPLFAIPSQMRDDLEELHLWDYFVNLLIEGFLILHSQSLIIINMALKLWGPTLSGDGFRRTLINALRVDNTREQIIEELSVCIDNCSSGEWDEFVLTKKVVYDDDESNDNDYALSDIDYVSERRHATHKWSKNSNLFENDDEEAAYCSILEYSKVLNDEYFQMGETTNKKFPQARCEKFDLTGFEDARIKRVEFGSPRNSSKKRKKSLEDIPEDDFELVIPENTTLSAKNWDVERCLDWARKNSFDFMEDLIISNEIDGELLLLLINPDLEDIGISDKNDRDNVMSAIEKLKVYA